MHEVGHTLGLRHNFRGSAGATKAQLADRTFTKANGLGVSVMDYSPPALSLDPEKQGDYHAGTIGTYDRWAIRYGYASLGPRELAAANGKGSSSVSPLWTPDAEINALRTVAREAADPTHLYGTDEDAGFGGLGLDPTVSRYDQTSDPLEWARDRVTLINGLFDSLDTRMVAPGESYARLRTAFSDLLNDRWYAILVTTKYLGGATTARDHRGDPSGRPALDHGTGRAPAGGAGLHHRGRIRGAGLSLPARSVEPARPGSVAALGVDARSGRPHRLPGTHLGPRAAIVAAGTAAGPRCAGPDS